MARAAIAMTLASAGAVSIGRFRCDPAHPSFTNSGPARGWLVVFPRTPVWIAHAGSRPVIADASRAILYNRGQEYTRAAIAPDGDRCEWFAFDARVVAEACATDDEERPFRATHAAVDARTYALQRRVVEHVGRGAIDPLFVEEASLAILARITRATAHERRGGREADGHRALADAVRTVAGTRLGDPMSLGAIARAVGRSPFHVARVFRAESGISVHAYRIQARLRASLERVAAGEDLTRVALDLGFASHSHFTTAFSRAFGEPPRAFRAATAASKKMEAASACGRAR